MSMKPEDFEKMARLAINHDVLAKEVELQRELIEQYKAQVAALKEANAALRELANRQSAPFGIPLPSMAGPLLDGPKCGGCGADLSAGRSHVCMGTVQGRAG